MTQSASPSQITLSGMRDLFAQKFPDLVEPFDQLKSDLEGGKGAQALGDLIKCEVGVHTDQGFSTYRWTGKNGPFELKVPKPFEPQPHRPSETQQQAQVRSEEPEPPHEAPQSVPESSMASETQDDTPEVPEADSEDQAATEEVAEPEPAPATAITQGLFAALAQLLGDSTLLMTVAKTGEEGKEPVLTVTVVPQGETESFTPVCLTGSVTELDTHFIPALESKVVSRKSLEQAVAELNAADKELEEVKMRETEVKRKQTETKKKSVEKLEATKQEPGKAEAVPPEPPKPEPQEALF